MSEKQIAMNPPFRIYNFKMSHVLFFSCAPYPVILFLLYRALPSEVILKAITTTSIIYWLSTYVFYMQLAVFVFHETHFELVCPLRILWRKASYRYRDVSTISFQGGRYSGLGVNFRESIGGGHAAWTIFADFRDEEQTLRQLAAFLHTKNVKISHNHYKDL